ncbi:MAG: sulfur carrier protein ThiS [Acidimicrobiales bacterium]
MSSPEPAAVEVVVNGEPMVVPATTTLDRLLALAGVPTRGVAIALAGEVVPRSAWRRTTLDPGARVEIVSAAAGG